ncbi:MAG TPA: hypothetical protein VLK33_00875 [Terriglobales bacterium]|nr:hypothetical protein [Terriglobales bacterium]
MLNQPNSDSCVDVCPPVRNRYFYGKMLDVFHFELEQQYFNNKRWLLNRLVSGYGVLCGLNVQLTSDYKSIVVTPGIAIDKCGHEIVVCQNSDPVLLPVPPVKDNPSAPQQPSPNSPSSSQPAPAKPAAGAMMPRTNGTTANGDGWDCGKFVHVSICYHECQSDPVPALGGDCDTSSLCSPGSIKERYCLELTEGRLSPARSISRLTDFVVNGQIQYAALASYVTNRGCQSACPDCCIPLANIRIPDAGQTYDPGKSIDISVRPVCYTNDLLYEMILAMQPGQSQSVASKP